MDVKREAELHWDYTGGIIESCGITGLALRLAEYMYKHAFAHGAKHMEEYLDAGTELDGEVNCSTCAKNNTPHCNSPDCTFYDRWESKA